MTDSNKMITTSEELYESIYECPFTAELAEKCPVCQGELCIDYSIAPSYETIPLFRQDIWEHVGDETYQQAVQCFVNDPWSTLRRTQIVWSKFVKEAEPNLTEEEFDRLGDTIIMLRIRKGDYRFWLVVDNDENSEDLGKVRPWNNYLEKLDDGDPETAWGYTIENFIETMERKYEGPWGLTNEDTKMETLGQFPTFDLVTTK